MGFVVSMFYSQTPLQAMNSKADVEKPELSVRTVDSIPDMEHSVLEYLGGSKYLFCRNKRMSPKKTPSPRTPSLRTPSPLADMSVTIRDLELRGQTDLDDCWSLIAWNYSRTPLEKLLCIIYKSGWFSEDQIFCNVCSDGHAFGTPEDAIKHLFTVHLNIPERLPEFMDFLSGSQ